MLSATSAEYRAHLRQLKLEFDAAYARVDPAMDRTDPTCIAAEDAYRAWSQAIDLCGLALLDDLDLTLAENARLSPSHP